MNLESPPPIGSPERAKGGSVRWLQSVLSSLRGSLHALVAVSVVSGAPDAQANIPPIRGMLERIEKEDENIISQLSRSIGDTSGVVRGVFSLQEELEGARVNIKQQERDLIDLVSASYGREHGEAARQLCLQTEDIITKIREARIELRQLGFREPSEEREVKMQRIGLELATLRASLENLTQKLDTLIKPRSQREKGR